MTQCTAWYASHYYLPSDHTKLSNSLDGAIYDVKVRELILRNHVSRDLGFSRSANELPRPLYTDTHTHT